MERKGFSPKALIATLVAGMILGGGGIYAWVHAGHGHEDAAPAAKSAEKKPQYVCPMHPTVVDDEPSNCPICGMKLVKAQSGEPEAQAAGTTSTPDEKAHATYVCPMHPSVVDDKPSNCPICGMKLVKTDVASAEAGATGGAAEQEKTYVCPMHPTVVSHEPGDCPICGMKLVPATGSGKIATVKGGERKIAFYRAANDPKKMSHEPMKDEGGRDYVPVYEDELYGSAAAAGLATVTIDPARQQLIGLKTARATEGEVGGSWRTAGKVTVDETRIRQVNVKISGFVEQIFVDFVGKPVKKGEPLFSIYSPELVSAQSEYLLAVRTRRALGDGGMLGESGDDLVASARRRLKFWDVPESELDRLERTGEVKKGLTLQSPISGVVTQKNVVQGARLNAGDIPYEITDLSKVWVLADIYESELRRVRIGMPATFTSRAYPSVEFKGQVIFIDPVISPETRTVKVRLAFDNPEGRLKPELFGEVVLHTPEGRGLTIPADAVVHSGTQQVVFVSVGNGKFQPRPIETGSQSGDRIEVVSGLIVGEEVVLRANFLVDSESRMKASLQAMQAAPASGASGSGSGSGDAGAAKKPATGHEGH